MKARAARVVSAGSPVVVAEVEVDGPGPGEVLVQMKAAGVNPLDLYVAQGRVAAGLPLPRTLGTEGVGLLEGRPVVIRGYGLGTNKSGVWASTVIVPSNSAIPVPDGVDLDVAAAIGVAGVTAWRTVTQKARIAPDDRVLVLGASGGVGSSIVSLVHSIGATVWGQTGNPSKAAWIEGLGAQRVIVGDATAVAATAGELNPTVVFDPLSGPYFASAVTTLAEGGRIVLFGASAGDRGEVLLQELYRKGISVYGDAARLYSDEVTGQHVAAALQAVRDGRFTVPVSERYGLDSVNEALEALRTRSTRGKIVLDLTT